MGLLEDRILRIIELRQKGAEDIAIASDLGLDETTFKGYENSIKNFLSNYASQGVTLRGISKYTDFSQVAAGIVLSYYGIKLKRKTGTQAEVVEQEPQKPRLSKRQINIDKISQAIKEGVKTRSEIAEKTGMSYSQVTYYDMGGYVNVPEKTKRVPVSERISQIRDLIEEGVESAEKIAEELGIGINTLRTYVNKYKIRLLDFEKNPYSYNKCERVKNRDRLIRIGLSLEKISGIGGCKVTRERIRQYIQGTGQYETWRKSRDYYKRAKFFRANKRKQELEKIAGQIIQVGLNKCSCDEERNAYLKTKEFFLRVNCRSLSFEQLFNFFERYFSALKNKERLTLNELGKTSGINFVRVGYILRKVGLEALHGKRKRILKKETRIYEKACGIEMPVMDIAYFSGYSSGNLNSYFYVHKEELGERPKPLDIDLGFKFHLRGYINYRLASQVYEAEDLGFSRHEILDLFDMNKKVYEVLHDNRRDIEKKIISTLQILNHDKIIDKPYKN